ncbi:hypothetical protein G9A89_005618 [Geosiphon pyriformis]|nr:hypothetical protein G9A89_005618 [Geosiphon pyriformis]
MSNLDNEFFGVGVAVIMNNSLACYVSKVKEFCINLGLVNLFVGYQLVDFFTWSNSKRVEKTIDYIFVSENLSFVIASYQICSVSDFFDTNHNTVLILIGLGGLLDVCLNSLHKQANKDHWRFKIKNANNSKWAKFRDCTSAKLLVVADKFSDAESCGNIDAMNKHSSKFIAKVVRKFSSDDMSGVDHLVKVWSTLNNIKACAFANMLCLRVKSAVALKHLLLAHKKYRMSKMHESRLVVLNYLVINNGLVLEPEEIKLSVDRIMEDWTRKCSISLYAPLVYVRNDAFSGVMCAVSMSELLSVVSGLPDSKATGLSALIKTARKILLKIFDNFLVLRGTSTQSLVFAIGLVVKNAFEKNREIWLVLQDMQKAYNSMCERFIKFFGSIHEDKVNKVMTDFSLSDSYRIFSPFLWKIFYDPLLCKVKRHEHLSSTQFALNITSKFFKINNISINSKKTVAISINQGIKILSLNIYEAHHYLGIFLFTDNLSKLNIIKTHSDFNFVLSNMCHKWNVMIRKGFKLKTCLPHDFSNAALHHLSFEVAALVSFFNTLGILGHLFSHKFLDLQVLSWAPLNSLKFSVKLHISPGNNFLAELVKNFLDNKLSLANNLLNAFCSSGCFPLLLILGKFLYFDFKRLNPHGPVLYWFVVVSKHLLGLGSSLFGSAEPSWLCIINILESNEFSVVKNSLYEIWSGFFEVFTNGLLKKAGSAGVTSRAAAYFLVLDLCIGVLVHGLVFSTIAKLQTVALFLEYVSFFSIVFVYFNSQTAINAYLAELSSAVSDFHNLCWIERCHIFNLIRKKYLNVAWVKVKRHLGVSGNVMADLMVGVAVCSLFSLLAGVCKHFLVAEDTPVSGNAHYFVRNIFWSVCCACWEAGSGCNMIPHKLVECVDWAAMTKIWHLDSHMLTGFISRKSSNLYTYLIKAVHRQLPIVVRKKIYDKCYPSVLCLLCDEVEFSDYAFTCAHNVGVCSEVLAKASAHWSLLSNSSILFAFAVLQVLSQCFLDIELYAVVYKRFVLKE